MYNSVEKYNHWGKDLRDSERALHSIKDTVLPRLISGRIHSIENSNNEILILMDVLSGIDLVRENKIGLQGIASRVQFCPNGKSYNTFTIRKERHSGATTELKKRLEQIDKGYLYPAFTLHAYFDDREKLNLINIAVIKTVDLFKAIRIGKKIGTAKSDNVFHYMHWVDLIELGYKLKTYGVIPNRNGLDSAPKLIHNPDQLDLFNYSNKCENK